MTDVDQRQAIRIQCERRRLPRHIGGDDQWWNLRAEMPPWPAMSRDIALGNSWFASILLTTPKICIELGMSATIDRTRNIQQQLSLWAIAHHAKIEGEPKQLFFSRAKEGRCKRCHNQLDIPFPWASQPSIVNAATMIEQPPYYTVW